MAVSVRPPAPGTPLLASDRACETKLNRPAGAVEVRFLTPGDIDGLLVLEHKKWTVEQAACREDMASRMKAYPRYCFGAFSMETGEPLASLFVKPIDRARIYAANTWAECATVDEQLPTGDCTLFGISLTSVDERALNAMLDFFLPHACNNGWRDIYLGSPVPGLRAWKRQNPDVPVDEYVYARLRNRPLDPQLYYYYEKGFEQIVACKPNYFPHERSLDYGAVIRAELPQGLAIAS
jgi:hypothetical protein